MRYIMVPIWSVLISSTISYVLTSMGGEAFNFQLTLIFAAVLAVGILLLGETILTVEKDPK